MSDKAQIFVVGSIDPFDGWWFCTNPDKFGSFNLDHGYTSDELRAIHKRYGERMVFCPPIVIDDTNSGPPTRAEIEQEALMLARMCGQEDEYQKFALKLNGWSME